VIKRYAGIVRKLFLISGLLLLATLPFLETGFSSAIFYSIALILVLTFFAGMTSPKEKQSILIDILVAVAGFVTFAYQATTKFTGFFDLFFFTNFSLAVLFLLAFYWSIRAVRSLEQPIKTTVSEAIFHDRKHGVKKEILINASEGEPSLPKPDLTEEERRKLRFLREDELG
jgi:cation transport ATPase